MLTDDEIETVRLQCANEFIVDVRNGDKPKTFARAVEAAVLAKLRGNVELPEPVAEVITLHYGSDHPPVAFTGVVLSDKTDYYSLPFREGAQFVTLTQVLDYGDRRAAHEREACASSIPDGWVLIPRRLTTFDFQREYESATQGINWDGANPSWQLVKKLVDSINQQLASARREPT